MNTVAGYMNVDSVVPRRRTTAKATATTQNATLPETPHGKKDDADGRRDQPDRAIRSRSTSRRGRSRCWRRSSPSSSKNGDGFIPLASR